MTESELQKVNERLYHEIISHDGQTLKWEKRFIPLYFELKDIEIEFRLSIYNSDKFKGTPVETEIEEEFSEQLGWHISGIGFSNRAMGVIKRDGSIEQIGKLEVSIASVSDAERKEPGYLSYHGREDWSLKYGSERDPYLFLCVNTSIDSLEKICHQILSKGLSKLRIRVEVECFQSEMVGAFGPPMEHDFFCIEEEGDSFQDNRVYLSSISASRSVNSTVSDSTDEIEKPA